MTCRFEFRRHSLKDAGHGRLGPLGYALAREVGRRQLRGRGFTACYASTLWRTHQTLAAFDEGAGDFTIHDTPSVAPFYLDWPQLKPLWIACCHAEQRGEDMVAAAFAHDPQLTANTAAAVAARFRRWAEAAKDGANVLVVGHSPYCELIVAGLTGERLHSLDYCQGFRLTWVDGAVSVEASAPDLDPSAIRRELFPKLA